MKPKEFPNARTMKVVIKRKEEKEAVQSRAAQRSEVSTGRRGSQPGVNSLETKS
jgi:hypothetical protein